jgi:hypothetical protein
MKIIALRSKRNHGKSATLKLLYSLLLLDGFSQVPDRFWNIGKVPNRLHYDFRSILVWNGIKIGVLTRGDITKNLKADLDFFALEGCKLAICPSGIWRWSLKDHFPETIYIGKSKGEKASEMYIANAKDAYRLQGLVKGTAAALAWT